MSAGVTDQAVDSQESSEAKYSLAVTRMQQVERDLKPQLESAEADVNTLQSMNQYTNDTLAIIDM